MVWVLPESELCFDDVIFSCQGRSVGRREEESAGVSRGESLRWTRGVAVGSTAEAAGMTMATNICYVCKCVCISHVSLHF